LNRPHGKHGFTLIELMVSTAMVLILILGVNAIFKMASDTVGTGQALAGADRENRSAQAVLYDDFRNAVITDAPFLLIRSEAAWAFRNRADEDADHDGGVLTVDLDPDTKGDESMPPSLGLPFHDRIHRVDRVGFFSNQLQKRQTGTHSARVCRFVDPGASAESLIWIGHLLEPSGAAGPGTRSYAADWILGRNVILLSLTPNPPAASTVPPSIYIRQEPPRGDEHRLSPLEPTSAASQRDAYGNDYTLQTSRYDLAETSIADFRDRLRQDIALHGARGKKLGGDFAWWELLSGTADGRIDRPTENVGTGRFMCDPYPRKPLTPASVAQASPIFVRGCSQFIVEYAGDYLWQAPDGRVFGTYLAGPAGVDGQVDFSVVLEQPNPDGPVVPVRRVRWYGMPRNVDTFDDLAGRPVVVGGLGTKDPNVLRDVVPLRDVLVAAGVTVPSDFFEHFADLEPAGDYASPRRIDLPTRPVSNYWAAWGPAELASGSLARPKMLRITMTVDEPFGRMAEGQAYEYIINLP
jgi:prepilin-type N-terminal cleavage/methylation domain-containing protein